MGVAALGGCEGATVAAPSSPSVMQPGSAVTSVVSSPVSTPSAADERVLAAARDWASRWCGWSWRDPHGVRESRAREVMTPDAGRALIGTDAEAWAREVVGTHETATCEPATVRLSAGPRTETRAHVAISAARTVRNDHGIATEMWREDRRVVLAYGPSGRWLVDVAVVGG
ncbi:hypothetical protein ACFORH_38905 [Amycolatopsis roodepoortensis]|uniref:Nuclear transport factor 2 family protein n=1 Tax=Amycolatopsis roodepoortensis TaxID=700274 RepID=A0ABR9LIQ5_9PSEU|nr:hypothetical protein [Amycolatopsis roodepoortensis]MBE1580559.1 hypothetical protein [Amycolatopsis roodepoortensis]